MRNDNTPYVFIHNIPARKPRFKTQSFEERQNVCLTFSHDNWWKRSFVKEDPECKSRSIVSLSLSLSLMRSLSRMLETRGGLRFRSVWQRRRRNERVTSTNPTRISSTETVTGERPRSRVVSEKKESLSWPDAIRRPEKRRGRGGYNGQNEIVLGHRGNVRLGFYRAGYTSFSVCWLHHYKATHTWHPWLEN